MCVGKAASGAFLVCFLAKLPSLGEKNLCPHSCSLVGWHPICSGLQVPSPEAHEEVLQAVAEGVTSGEVLTTEMATALMFPAASA